MRNRVVAGQLDHAIVARQHAVDRHGEGSERRFSAQTGKDMRSRAAFMVAPLRADMVEGRIVSNFNFQHLVETCRSWAIFQQRQFCPCIQLDAVVKDRIGSV